MDATTLDLLHQYLQTVESLRKRVEELESHEPGETICNCTCPCCGAELDVHYGEDEGQICVAGSAAAEDEP